MRSTYPLRLRPLTFVVSAFAVMTATAAIPKNWSEWTDPTNLSALNSAGVDGCASLSPDGRELWFTSTRGGGAPDIYVATRTSPDAPWGAAVNVAAVNTPAPEACPTMTRGGKLYFTRQAPPDPPGDLYVARRGPKGWSTPERLGPNINQAGSIEESATFYEDSSGRQVMYFSSSREGRNRIYQSINGGPAELVAGGVNSSAADARPTVRKDGLEIFFDSNRGPNPNIDFWTATRSSTSAPWGEARRLHFSSSESPGQFFQPGFDARPSVSWDGSEMVFGSFRTTGDSVGLVDIWTTSRSKVTGRN